MGGRTAESSALVLYRPNLPRSLKQLRGLGLTYRAGPVGTWVGHVQGSSGDLRVAFQGPNVPLRGNTAGIEPGLCYRLTGTPYYDTRPEAGNMVSYFDVQFSQRAAPTDYLSDGTSGLPSGITRCAAFESFTQTQAAATPQTTTNTAADQAARAEADRKAAEAMRAAQAAADAAAAAAGQAVGPGPGAGNVSVEDYRAFEQSQAGVSNQMYLDALAQMTNAAGGPMPSMGPAPQVGQLDLSKIALYGAGALAALVLVSRMGKR